MEISRSGPLPSMPGPADGCTGPVRVDPMFRSAPPGTVAGGHVTVAPGARTAWYTRLAGQTIVVTFGRGRVQRDGGPVAEIAPGDVVRFEPGAQHGRGASSQTAMRHVAIREAVDGGALTLLEKVCDADAGPAPGRPRGTIPASAFHRAGRRRVSRRCRSRGRRKAVDSPGDSDLPTGR